MPLSSNQFSAVRRYCACKKQSRRLVGILVVERNETVVEKEWDGCGVGIDRDESAASLVVEIGYGYTLRAIEALKVTEGGCLSLLLYSIDGNSAK